MKKILVLGALSLFGLGSSVSAMDGKADQDEQALVESMERLQLSPSPLSPAEIPAQKADQDEQTLVEGMERLRLSPSPQSPAEIPAQRGNIKSAVKSAVYGTNKPTSARLMVRYFDEHIADVGRTTVSPKHPAYTSTLREALEGFTRDEYVSVYHLLPMGLFRYLPQSIPDVEHVAEIVDLDRAIVRDMLHTLEIGNELKPSSGETAALERLHRAQEFIQEARGDA